MGRKSWGEVGPEEAALEGGVSDIPTLGAALPCAVGQDVEVACRLWRGGDRKMGWSSAARLPRQPSTHVLPFRRCVSDPLLKGPELTWLALWGAGPLYKKMHLLRVPGAMKTPPHQQLMMFGHTAHNRQKVGTAQGVHQQVSGKTSVTGLHSGMFPSQKKE